LARWRDVVVRGDPTLTYRLRNHNESRITRLGLALREAIDQIEIAQLQLLQVIVAEPATPVQKNDQRILLAAIIVSRHEQAIRQTFATCALKSFGREEFSQLLSGSVAHRQQRQQ